MRTANNRTVGSGWLCGIALLMSARVAFGQGTFEPDFQLSILPMPPTSSGDTLLNFAIPNVGVAVGSTFSPGINIDGQSILVELDYGSPVIPPGGVGVPSSFFPDGTINLGRLLRGNYALTAVFNVDNTFIASANTTFTVVPEPSAAMICLVALYLCTAFRAVRLTRRCS
jgi:hypothetical protein